MKDKATEKAIAQLRAYCRRKHLALSTERTYTHWLRRYCRAIPKMPRSLSSRQRVERFLSSLAHSQVSASTQNQAFNAILCFYRNVLDVDLGNISALRARDHKRVRYAPTKAETEALLDAVRDTHNYPTRLIVHLLYGCGLRVSEALNIRVNNLALDRRELSVRDSKTDDRVVQIPACVAGEIRQQIEHARIMWTRDQQSEVPVALPHRLAVKYPSACRAWGWYWLFPAHKTCKHPRTGQTVRYRCHESNVQRCVRSAAKDLGLAGLITPHCLRHAYATHMLADGSNIRDVQASLGHKSLETTMVYLHPHTVNAGNPLDRILKIGHSGHQKTAFNGTLINHQKPFETPTKAGNTPNRVHGSLIPADGTLIGQSAMRAKNTA